MRLLEDVNADKLRGGFYTPPSVVTACLDRIARLSNLGPAARVLEPSAGDGAFLRGLADSTMSDTVEVTAVELLTSEAAKCGQVIAETGLAGRAICESFFSWVDAVEPTGFDALVGNPPFVRYQFVNSEDRCIAEKILERRGVSLAGVSNLWIAFCLVSLDLLRSGGPFALVLPAELLSTVSASQVRQHLAREFSNLQVDLFPRDTFSDILQDVVVLSGLKRARSARSTQIKFVEHRPDARNCWQHKVQADGTSWTRYLLKSRHLDAMNELCEMGFMHRLGDLARLQVSIVTGANKYFTVPDEVVRDFALEPWARPLLARSEDSLGLVHSEADHARTIDLGRRSSLLDFNADSPDPLSSPRAATYILSGEAARVDTRYKCRIRNPWYRVPHIQSGHLMLSKRAHSHPRLVLNQAGVFTTDTIYRGEMVAGLENRSADLVAGFHNSLTLLSAELEGRSYGGGVLELVPSEIARLRVPMLDLAQNLPQLDELSRSVNGQKDMTCAVADATDAALVRAHPELGELLPSVRESWMVMRNRRLGKRSSGGG